MLFYTKCKRVTIPIARTANELVSTWSRPIIKRSASYRDRLIPTASDGDVDGLGGGGGPGGGLHHRPSERLNVILARMKESDKGRVRKNAVMIPQRELGNYTVAPRASAGLMMGGGGPGGGAGGGGRGMGSASVENDIERRRRTAERLSPLGPDWTAERTVWSTATASMV